MGFIPLHKSIKKSATPLLKQIIDLIPNHIFYDAVNRFHSNKGCSTYKAYDQFVSMIFGQLNKCLSLREINLGLGVDDKMLRDLGLNQSPAKSTMSDGNTKRDWRVFEYMYLEIVNYYKNVFSKQQGYQEIKEIEGRSIKLVDATIMTVCLNLFDWAEYRTAKGGVKAHVCLDEKTMLPEIINITEARLSDRRGVDNFRYPKDTIIVDDRGYYDFKLFGQRIEDKNHFVTRMKTNTVYDSIRELELPDDKDYHILKDEIITLKGKAAQDAGLNDIELRRVVVMVEETDRKTKKVQVKAVALITNNLKWSAATIAALYKRRWQIETFFKLLKQNLQIKNFLGTNENSNKSQIYIAIITYFLIELIRRSISKVKHEFGHFATIVRICLLQYKQLQYVANEISMVVKKARQYDKKNLDHKQLLLNFNSS